MGSRRIGSRGPVLPRLRMGGGPGAPDEYVNPTYRFEPFNPTT